MRCPAVTEKRLSRQCRLCVHRCFGACLEKIGKKDRKIECYYTKNPYIVKKISGDKLQSKAEGFNTGEQQK
jgi:hypothetical protein